MRLLIRKVGMAPPESEVADVTIENQQVAMKVADPRYKDLLEALFLKPQFTFGDGVPGGEDGQKADPPLQKIMPGDPDIVRVLPEHLSTMGLDFIIAEERK